MAAQVVEDVLFAAQLDVVQSDESRIVETRFVVVNADQHVADESADKTAKIDDPIAKIRNVGIKKEIANVIAVTTEEVIGEITTVVTAAITVSDKASSQHATFSNGVNKLG